MMEEQLEEGRREMEECDVVKRKVERVLREIEDGKFHGGRGDSGQDMGAKAQGEELHVKQLWKMMTDIDAGMD